MNIIEKLLDYKRKIEILKENVKGMEFRYKGYHAVIMYVNLNDTATLYLEDENGESWEEMVDLTDLENELSNETNYIPHR